MLYARWVSQSSRVVSGKLPHLKLFTKPVCPLCDEALEKISPLSNQFKLSKVDISAPGNEKWWQQYKYDIPVFHFEGEFLMKHRANFPALKKAIDDYNASHAMTSLDQLWWVAQHGQLNDLHRYLKQLRSADLLLAAHEKSGDHVTHVLSRNGKAEMLTILHQDWGVPLERMNLDGKVPLHEAALHGHSAVVEYLVCHVTNIDPLKHGGWTPLMMACAKSNLEVVKVLVEKGANVQLKNKDGWNCFHIACREDCMEVIRYLHRTSPSLWKNISHNGRSPLHTAALHGQTEVAAFIIDVCGARFDARDACGTSPFLDSVRSGDLSCMKLFLDHNTDCFSHTNAMGLSCLHVAAEANRPDLLLYLSSTYSLNVDIAVITEGLCKGQTPMHFARKERNQEAIDMLKKLKAVDNIKDAQGRTGKEMELLWQV